MSLHFIFFYTAKIIRLYKALMTDLKNVNDPIMALNENELLHVILYENKSTDNNKTISILTAKGLINLFLNYY